MSVTFYPKRLLATALFLVVFGVLLTVAVDARQGIAVAGIVSLLAYFFVELFVTFNLTNWLANRQRRP